MRETKPAFSLEAVQGALNKSHLNGWLFYDFRGLDLIARRILGLDPTGIASRRWFYYVPAEGTPAKLVHSIEPGMLDSLPGPRIIYLTWQSLREGLAKLLHGATRIAMQYSPQNEIPYVSRVDAGTVELVRSTGVEVVSSADLVQLFDATLSRAQIDGHKRAAKVLRSLVDDVFARAASVVRSRQALTERSLLDYVEARLADEELIYDHPAIVAVNAHSADPHFEVPVSGSASIKSGDLLLFDVWAKERAAGSIYADITWTAYVGEKVPEEMAAVFKVVREARDAVVAKAEQAIAQKKPLHGFELDRAARDVIVAQGYGEFFVHRTGHSIHEEVHGNGANLDDLETHDTRLIVPNTVFSVEPGIYFPGRFGIRSELDLLHAGAHVEVTGPPPQTELRALLAQEVDS